MAAWRREFEVRSLKSLEREVWSEELRKARLTLNSAGGVLRECQRISPVIELVEMPGAAECPRPNASTSSAGGRYESANVRVADRSKGVPTFIAGH